jgi:hypothetical protein
MNKISICHYVAYNSPENAKKILQAWGIPVTGTNKKGLADSLQALLRQEGEPVLMDLANLHPDKDLIFKVEEIKAERNQPAMEKTSGCNGDTACAKCSEKKSNACGCGMSSFGGSWNIQEGAFYTPPRNFWVDEYQVYGFDGKGQSSNKGALLFGGIAVVLAYMLYKNS